MQGFEALSQRDSSSWSRFGVHSLGGGPGLGWPSFKRLFMPQRAGARRGVGLDATCAVLMAQGPLLIGRAGPRVLKYQGIARPHRHSPLFVAIL